VPWLVAVAATHRSRFTRDRISQCTSRLQPTCVARAKRRERLRVTNKSSDRKQRSPAGVVEEFLVARDVSYGYRAAGAFNPCRCCALQSRSHGGRVFCSWGERPAGRPRAQPDGGLLQPASGELTLADSAIQGPRRRSHRRVPERRTPCSPGAHHRQPWRSACACAELSEKRRHAIAREYLHLVHLDGQGEQYPGELSGGMKQRVPDRPRARRRAQDPLMT